MNELLDWIQYIVNLFFTVLREPVTWKVILCVYAILCAMTAREVYKTGNAAKADIYTGGTILVLYIAFMV